MRCANPNCYAMADNLLMGTLALVEFETAPDNRILHAGGGFPICVTRTRYFWLCQACSCLFRIRKWNSSGLILEPQHRNASRISDPTVGRKTASTAISSEPERPRSLYGAA